jgi:hypothetical protein
MNEEQRKNAIQQLKRQLRTNPNDKAVLKELGKLGSEHGGMIEKVKSAKSKQDVQDLTLIDLDLRRSLKDLKLIVLKSL